MRALIKKDDINSFMIEADCVQYEEYLGEGKIRINAPNGFVTVTTYAEELESIRTNWLKDGYFDFRNYKVDLDYFEF